MAAGDLGYTTGPWVLSDKTDAKKPPAHGQFVSIWKRDPGGDWRVAIDLGIVHARPDSGEVRLAVCALDAPAAGDPAADPLEMAKDILAADRALSGAVARGGAAAFDSARPATPPLRMGYAPFAGREAGPEGPLGQARPLFLGAGRRGGFAFGRPRIFLWGRKIPLRRRGPRNIWLVALDIALGVPVQKAGS